MEIFLSYARPDQLRADSIAQQLRQAGNDVWQDHDLAGGQIWWDGILGQLRRCDAAVTVVSRSALRSQACIRERQYAERLGKPILPLAIERIAPELLPTDLARLQVIDYSQPGEAAAFQLLGAIMRLPQHSALPEPLPDPPRVPESSLGPIAEQLSAESLSQDQQLAIIGRLESALAPTADPNDRPIALDLLGRLEQRSDLLAAVDRRMRALRASLPGSEMPRTSPPRPAQQQQPPQPRPTMAASGGTGSSWPGPQPASNLHQQTGYERQQTGGLHQQTGALRQQASPAAGVTPHWAMAIFSLVFFFPLGIPACIYAARVRSSLESGDLERANKAVSLVKIFFWITVALCVLVLLGKLA